MMARTVICIGIFFATIVTCTALLIGALYGR